jgi:hypothetical protein
MYALDEQVKAIDTHTLADLVRRATKNEKIEITHWSCVKVNADYNPMTGGIYRFSGYLRDPDRLELWSLILKVVQWTDLTALLGRDYTSDPGHLFYWKREALAFQSGILSGWQGGLVPVQCYGVVEATATSSWLWLEDVQEPYESVWNLDRHILAARHFGEFNGGQASEGAVPASTWLSRRFLRQWLSTFASFSPPELLQDPLIWDQPLLKRAFPIPLVERLVYYLQENHRLLDLLDRQPQTLSHLDSDRRNLMTRRNPAGQEQTAAIDWGFVGLAAVGEDLSNQVLGNLYHLEVAPSDFRHYRAAAFDAYLDGLQDVGWQGSVEMVRFASLTHALHYLSIVPWMVHAFIIQDSLPPWAAKWAANEGCSVEATLERWGEGIYILLDIADEARQMAVG